MKIAIIGTGNVGKALGTGWASAGHDIIFGSRQAGTSAVAALEEQAHITVAQPSVAAEGAEIVVLATPWPATRAVVESLGDLAGKTVIDCTNPIGPNFSFQALPGQSGGEQVAGWAKGAHVVKAFNTTGAKNMMMPQIDVQKLAMFMCGDNVDAKRNVSMLAEALGFDAIDNGGLTQAFYLEAMAMVWITQAYQQGWGPDFGFVVARRGT